jgi:hypothetical protein
MAMAALLDPADLDGVLDAITALKARQKQLEQELEPLLEVLSAAMAAGQLDPSFCHNDWAFSHSPGRLSYDFPAPVLELERQLKAARDAAIRQGTASEKRGKPFWSIRAPRALAAIA